MKKSILCILVAALAMIAGATPVTSSQAKQAARAWAQRNAAFVGNDVAVDGSPVAVTNAEGVTLWYRVALKNGSCLVVSPVMELEPVIACLERVGAGGLPADHPMHAMLERDMADRLKKLGLYEPAATGPVLMGASPLQATPEDPVMAAWAEEGKAKWARLTSGGGPQLMAAKEEGLTEIDIQMGIVDGFEKGGRFTHWNQSTGGGGYCYNYYTPNHAVCGCVATSMGAMMQFFAVTGCVADATCPSGLVRETQDHTVGATYNGGGAGSYLTKGGAYDWSLLDGKTDRAGYDDLTDAQRELLGRVAYDCGVAVAMAWTSGESSAYVMDVASALRNVFGFKDARAVFNPTEDQYVKLIYHQCRAGAPVQLGINSTTSSAGHSVLAVGYGEDEDGVPRTRIFTGWGGSGDGWYALPYITTASIPGGGSHNFDVIQQVVTMVGYDSDETVPVVGHMDAPGEAIEVPGVQRTIYANENGYFGTRVSPNLSDCRLLCRGKEAQFEIGAAAKVEEDVYWVDDVDGLCSALPEEIEFILLNSSVAYTFAKAKEMALAEGKAILRISGVTGTEPTTNLLAYIYALDDQNVGGFTNKFVYFFSSAKASNPDLPDGNPSIGVFLPSDAEQSGRWQYTNGRLAYGYGYARDDEWTESAIDDETDEVTNIVRSVVRKGFRVDYGAETNDFRYVDIEDGVANDDCPYDDFVTALEAMTQSVLDEGWDEFCRRTHGITLTVAATPSESGLPDPTFGVHENTYTNAQEITAIAPDGEVTNDAQTVVSEFSAWTLTVTNTVAGGRATVTKGTGAQAVFTLSSNDVASLVWELEPKFMKISIRDKYDSFYGDDCVASPGSDWYPYGETVSFTATPGSEFYFDQWGSDTGFDLPYYLDSFRYQPTISFRVEEPLSLVASYNPGDSDPEEEVSAEAQTLTVMSLYADGESYVLLDDDNLPTTSVTIYPDGTTQQVDDDIELPAGTSAAGSIAANAFTDGDGAEWKCVGWKLCDMRGEVLAKGNGTITSRFALEDSAYLYWIWEDQTEEEDDPAEERQPAKVPYADESLQTSPLTIKANADGTLTVEADIGNAVKGWWYVLKTAGDLAGPYTKADGADCVKLAEADGTLKLSCTFTPTEEKRFYKVTVEGDKP